MGSNSLQTGLLGPDHESALAAPTGERHRVEPTSHNASGVFLAGEASTCPADILSSVQEGRLVIQDSCRIADSLEWELSRVYYEERGGSVFRRSRDHVPFEINNDGNLSSNAAELFFTSLAAAEASGPLDSRLFALEVGPGTGLFARYFLDSLRDLCARHRKNFYERFCFVVTDISERMLKDIGESGILADHAGRFRLAKLDAMRVDVDLRCAIAKAEVPGRPFRAVFLNYLLDSLPATVLAVKDNEVKELYTTTCLGRGVDLKEHTRLCAEQIARKGASIDPADKRELVELYPLFALELSYQRCDVPRVPYGEFAVQFGRSHGGYVLHNYGAIACLEQCLRVLHDDGFILINDYGVTKQDESVDAYVHQKFSGATAISINFPLLKGFFESLQGYCWIEPDEDNGQIVARLVARRAAQKTIDRFRERFGKARYEWVHEPTRRAQSLLSQGRYEMALDAYREALSRQPRNWFLMAEVAKFLTFTLRDYAAGVEMAKAALALNPSCSADLWNTLGDGLFCLQQVDAAREAFDRAVSIDPTDVRARFNLSYVYDRKNDLGAALNIIAQGLALDRTGEYRERLLQKQREILNRLSHRYQMEARFLADRVSRYLGSSTDGQEFAAKA